MINIIKEFRSNQGNDIQELVGIAISCNVLVF